MMAFSSSASSRAKPSYLLMLLTILLSVSTKQILVVEAQLDDDDFGFPVLRPEPPLNPTDASSLLPPVTSVNPSPSPSVYIPTASTSSSEIPSDIPSLFPTTYSPSIMPTSNPSLPYTFNNIDTEQNICQNSPGWTAPSTFMQNGQWVHGIFDCDHPSISCQRTTRLGPATEHCCKCRPECCGQCKERQPNELSFSGDPCSPADGATGGGYDDGTYRNPEPYDDVGPLEGIDVLRFIFSAMGVTFCVVGGLLAIRHQQSRELRDARRIMAERRRIQRERERLEGQQSVDVDARYQQIVQSFLFQNVNSNKTNISADSIRGGRGDGEAPPNPEEEEESPNRSESFKKNCRVGANPRMSAASVWNTILLERPFVFLLQRNAITSFTKSALWSGSRTTPNVHSVESRFLEEIETRIEI